MNDGNVHTPKLDDSYSVFGRVFRLALKELREILRDRRTIITLFAMPILLYPLVSIIFRQLYFRDPRAAATLDFRIGAVTDLELAIFASRYRHSIEMRGLAEEKPDPADPKKTIPDRNVPVFLGTLAPDVPKNPTADDRAEAMERLQEMLREGKIDLIFAVPDFDIRQLIANSDQSIKCEVYSVPTSVHSRTALVEVERLFAAVDQRHLLQRLHLPLDVSYRKLSHIGMLVSHSDPISQLASAPFTHETIPRVMVMRLDSIAVDAQTGGGISLAALVPLILILMTITGAVYPAIDLTAGERERGTLEILVAAPVSRFELLSAKYFSVLTVAILTAMVNLVCMVVTIQWSGLGAALFRDQELSFVTILQILALLLLFAAFFSALLLCLTSFARSFKEAQAYLIPLMLASLAPGVMAMMPGLKLGGVLTIVPLVNIVLLARDTFDMKVEALPAAIVILSTLLYALAALSLAARVFGAESVLYSEQSSWADLLRRPEQLQPSASIPAAFWCLALMVPIQFSLLAGLRGIFPVTKPHLLILLFVAINGVLFGLLPALFLFLGRVNLVRGLGLRRTHPMSLFAGLLLGASLWPYALLLLTQESLPTELRDRYAEVLRSMREAQTSLGWWVLIQGIVPAVLEELFFRGLLFHALKRRSGPVVTIGVSGLLFGLTHVILDGVLGLERLVPSTLLGLILSVVCWRAGSIWPSVVLHVAHNVILMVLAIQGIHAIEWYWLAGGAIGVVIGALLLFWFGHTPMNAEAGAAGSSAS